MFPVETIKPFARTFPKKVNYESIVDRGRFKAQSFLKMTPNEMSDGSERGVKKDFINVVNLSKFLAILYRKPIEEVIFSKAACLSLQLY